MLKQDALLLVSIFCDVDDFCKEFEPEWKKVIIEDKSGQSPQSKNRTIAERSDNNYYYVS